MVVIVYNMEREAPRTLFSLSSRYQKEVSDELYEVIVIENGSRPELEIENCVSSLGSNFRYYRKPDPNRSPAPAINYGVGLARGEFVGIMIDGARILSPGVLKYAFKGIAAYREPLIDTLSFHIGPDIQRISMQRNYDQKGEDLLLHEIDWKNNGYRLFDISTMAGNSKFGWFRNKKESTCYFLRKDSFLKIGGYDERFNTPGGGLCNHDFFCRAKKMKRSELIMILGEGSFHQFHHGTVTNNPDFKKNKVYRSYLDEYKKIKGIELEMIPKDISFVGHLHENCLSVLYRSVEMLSI
jgi:hypothetical protein